MSGSRPPKSPIVRPVHEAPALAERGERVVSTDELTGVQALERLHPGLPLAPGQVERREFEYIRHGTRAFILNRDVVSGQVVAPTCGPTRTEADFSAHVRRHGRHRPGGDAVALRGGQPGHPPLGVPGAARGRAVGRSRRTWA